MNTNENDSVAEEDVPLYAAARFAYKVANGEFTSSWGMHPELIALSLQFVSWFERTQQRPFGDDSYLLKEHALSFSPTVKKQLKRLKKRRSTKSRKSEKPLKTDARKEMELRQLYGGSIVDSSVSASPLTESEINYTERRLSPDHVRTGTVPSQILNNVLEERLQELYGD